MFFLEHADLLSKFELLDWKRMIYIVKMSVFIKSVQCEFNKILFEKEEPNHDNVNIYLTKLMFSEWKMFFFVDMRSIYMCFCSQSQHQARLVSTGSARRTKTLFFIDRIAHDLCDPGRRGRSKCVILCGTVVFFHFCELSRKTRIC